MNAERSSEKSEILYKTALRHMPEDSVLHRYSCENLSNEPSRSIRDLTFTDQLSHCQISSKDCASSSSFELTLCLCDLRWQSWSFDFLA
jgi:hypothetical protein